QVFGFVALQTPSHPPNESARAGTPRARLRPSGGRCGARQALTRPASPGDGRHSFIATQGAFPRRQSAAAPSRGLLPCQKNSARAATNGYGISALSFPVPAAQGALTAIMSSTMPQPSFPLAATGAFEAAGGRFGS